MCSLMNGIGLDIDNEEDLVELLVVVDVDVVEPNNKKKSTGSVDLKRKFRICLTCFNL